MRRNKVADFQIIRIEKVVNGWEELYKQLSKGIRDDDIVGLIENNDTHCYVLLAHAEIKNIGIIKDRLHILGLNSEHIEELESD